MSASEDSLFTRPFAPMLFDVVRAHAPYCYRCPLGLNRATCAIECLGAGGRAAEGRWARCSSEHGESVAAVMVEPMLQGAGGMIVWPAEYLAGVRRLCDQHGVLMIADEVLTGFGRTGRMFACDHAGVTPDIICLSKALTGGYLPLGATVTTQPVYDAFLSEDRSRTFFHGHSFTANPLACAVANASLSLLHETDALARVGQLERWLTSGLERLRALPIVGDIRVLGGVGVVELVADRATKSAGGYLDQIGPRLTQAFLERGLLLRPLGNVLYLMPPYVITESETAWAIDQMHEVLASFRMTGRTDDVGAWCRVLGCSCSRCFGAQAGGSPQATTVPRFDVGHPKHPAPKHQAPKHPSTQEPQSGIIVWWPPVCSSRWA